MPATIYGQSAFLTKLIHMKQRIQVERHDIKDICAGKEN